MKIETKFNIGDIVYYLISNTIKMSKISRFKIESIDTNKHIVYYSLSGLLLEEKFLYKTKEECAGNWLKQNDIDVKLK